MEKTALKETYDNNYVIVELVNGKTIICLLSGDYMFKPHQVVFQQLPDGQVVPGVFPYMYNLSSKPYVALFQFALISVCDASSTMIDLYERAISPLQLPPQKSVIGL